MTKRFISIVLTAATLLSPSSSRAELTEAGIAETLPVASITTASLDGLATLQAASQKNLASGLLLNEKDRQDWQELGDKDLDNYDKRLMTQLFPSIIGQETGNTKELIIDRVRRGYEQSETETSREVDGATNVSAHHSGKAASIAAIGTTYCFTETLVPQNIRLAKPIWLHWQTGEADAITPIWPFARGLDALARQLFWLDARSFTNRPITSLTWSNFLQSIAKSEIEERFGLQPGTLARTGVSDLPEAIAKARLAHDLGLSRLPEVSSTAEFYTILGEEQIASELNLPSQSLVVSKDWRTLYQQIAVRVLEDQLALPDGSLTGENVASSGDFIASDRFKQLVARLLHRSPLYRDARLAFDLPSEEYLATGSGSDLYTRLINGDPDGLAIIGAYYLAESLELPETEIKQFVGTISEGQDRPPNLRSARPLNPSLGTDRFFSQTTSEHQNFFEALGRKQEATIEKQLPRLNESVLLALSGSGRAPSLAQVLDSLTRGSLRDNLIAKLAKASSEDANYFTQEGNQLESQITIENLRARGLALFAPTVGVTPTELLALETSPDNPDQAVTTTVDQAMGWQSGTTLDLIRQNKGSEATELLQEKQQLLGGLNRLWTILGFTSELQQSLNQYYLKTDETLQTEPTETDQTGTGEELSPSPTPSPTVTSEPQPTDSETDNTPDETVTFAIPLDNEPLLDELEQALTMSRDQASLFLTGQMAPALKQATIALLAQTLGQETTITPAELFELAKEPNEELAVNILKQIGTNPLLSRAFGTAISKAAKEHNSYLLWQAFQGEAAYQWDMTCPDKQTIARQAISEFVKLIVALPEESENDGPTRPVQILTNDSSFLPSETQTAITAAYPEADGQDTKWGVYAVPRAWDHLYIGY